jgi:hypothetical protein
MLGSSDPGGAAAAMSAIAEATYSSTAVGAAGYSYSLATA